MWVNQWCVQRGFFRLVQRASCRVVYKYGHMSHAPRRCRPRPSEERRTLPSAKGPPAARRKPSRIYSGARSCEHLQRIAGASSAPRGLRSRREGSTRQWRGDVADEERPRVFCMYTPTSGGPWLRGGPPCAWRMSDADGARRDGPRLWPGRLRPIARRSQGCSARPALIRPPREARAPRRFCDCRADLGVLCDPAGSSARSSRTPLAPFRGDM